MVEAYLYFYECLRGFFVGTNGDIPIAADYPIADRAEECFKALKNALMVVVIDLQKDDDPQVIFETLNARGEPLLPADLLRNFIFFRVNRAGQSIEENYAKYWQGFDDDFWREEVKQGRLVRPRSDLFMQHFLASRQGQDIPIKHLYVEYRHWLERSKPFSDEIEELKCIARQRDHFRRIISAHGDDVLYDICVCMEAFDVRTSYPLLLTLLDIGVHDNDWPQITNILESYIVRRAVCNLSTKNYNKVFLSLAKNIRAAENIPSRLRELLLAQSGDSSLWPDDVAFRAAWLDKPAYGSLNNPRLVHILSRLNQTFMSTKAEHLSFTHQPTIEHIMPQEWVTNWPLENGGKGLSWTELQIRPETDESAAATRKRNMLVQTLGNLTLLSSGLNSAQSNFSWDRKKTEMAKHSLLPMNRELLNASVWNEASITERGDDLFSRAKTVWAR